MPLNDRLRLFTANLWAGGAHPDALARQLEELRVDVCAVQELAPAQARAIAAVLPHGKLEPEGDLSRGMGLATRHPTEVQRLSLPDKDARLALLDPTHWPQLDAPLEVCSLHVHAPHAGWPWRTLDLRRRQVRELLAYLDRTPGRPRAWLGDLNATPLWPAYRRLAARLRDAAHEHAERRGARPARTWAPHPGLPRLLRIDHALVHGVSVLDARVVRVAGSDHAGLLIELGA